MNKHTTGAAAAEPYLRAKIKLTHEEMKRLHQLQLPFPLEPADFELQFDGDAMDIPQAFEPKQEVEG